MKTIERMRKQFRERESRRDGESINFRSRTQANVEISVSSSPSFTFIVL